MTFDKLKSRKRETIETADEHNRSWEIKKLGELCNIELGKTPYRKDKSFWDKEKQTENVWLSIADLLNVNGAVVSDSKEYISDKATDISKVVRKGTLLVSFKLTLGRLAFAGRDLYTNEAIAALTIKNEKEIDKYFLHKYLSFFDWDKAAEGDVKVKGKTLNKSKLKEIEVQFPKSLPEQQRIVSILDEAFAAIAKAKANAEQNLKNAKELFESYLQGVFEKKGDGWEEQLFENCFKLKSGGNLTAKNMIEGEYPVFGGNGIAGYHNEYNLSGSNVIIGRVGALCGNVRHINENIWLTDNAFKVVDFKFDFDHSFLTYLLNHKDLRSYARQAAQPVISNSSLKDVVLFFPKSKTEQQTIVRQLDALRAETQKLEAVYQKKIADLEELKKSILQKAFAGELTESKIKEPCV